MPSSLVEIGSKAFRKCAKLAFVRLPPSLETIDDEAFALCANLKKIEAPATLRVTGSNAFLNCRDLVYADLQEGIVRIRENAFSGCRSLKKARVPASVEEVANGTFASCSSLLSVEVAKELKAICDRAFEGCSSLRNVAVAGATTRVGKDAFAKCTTLLEQTGDKTDEGIVSALTKRFNQLPVHELCYCQSYYPSSILMEKLKIAFRQYDASPDEPFDLRSGDNCLGTTPLGILSMSAKPDFAFAKGLISVHSASELSQKDVAGYTAHDYLCLNSSSASLKLVKFCVQQIVNERIDAFTLDQWKMHILRELNNIPKGWAADARRKHISHIYTKVDEYEFMEDL